MTLGLFSFALLGLMLNMMKLMQRLSSEDEVDGITAYSD
jgi:hypothetical protein